MFLKIKKNQRSWVQKQKHSHRHSRKITSWNSTEFSVIEIPEEFGCYHFVIGSGSYSRVARATFGDKKIEVAAKVINITPTREKDDYIKKFLPREKEIVKLLKHDNICRLYEMISFPDHIIFVTEFCAGGDLLRKMKDIKTMNEDEAKFMFRQFIAALTVRKYGII